MKTTRTLIAVTTTRNEAGLIRSCCFGHADGPFLAGLMSPDQPSLAGTDATPRSPGFLPHAAAWCCGVGTLHPGLLRCVCLVCCSCCCFSSVIISPVAEYRVRQSVHSFLY